MTTSREAFDEWHPDYANELSGTRPHDWIVWKAAYAAGQAAGQAAQKEVDALFVESPDIDTDLNGKSYIADMIRSQK